MIYLYYSIYRQFIEFKLNELNSSFTRGLIHDQFGLLYIQFFAVKLKISLMWKTGFNIILVVDAFLTILCMSLIKLTKYVFLTFVCCRPTPVSL